MTAIDHTGATETWFALLVLGGVAGATVYDVSVGDPPSGVLPLGAGPGLALVLGSCALAAGLVVALGRLDPAGRVESPLRDVLLLVCLGPLLFADPTYGALAMSVPLIDRRRRDADPRRSWLSAAILIVTAAIVLLEDTRRTTIEFEAMMTLAIGFVAMGVLGDALRRLDEGVEVERRLAALDERSRLAEELHDSLGHHLLAGSVQLRTAQALRERDPAAAQVSIGHASTAVAQAIAETRLIVDASRGDERFDIEPSIRELVQRILPTGTTMEVHLDGDHDELTPATRVAVYRLVQEALSNLVRHSGATAASIRSTAGPERVTVEVVDNGVGFDVGDPGRSGGLANMRRRIEDLGGVFRVDSGLDGTLITATVPR